MLSIQIPEISSVAGDLSDGVFVGKINKVNPTAVLLGETLVPISQVLRKAVTASGAIWQDFSTEATNATTGDFAPFGSASDMSAGDAFYIRTANDEDVHSFYVQISTAGSGTWTLGLQEWNTATEAWEDVTGLNDTSLGFTAGAGIYQISYTSGAEGLVRIDDASPKYVWHRFVLKTFTSAVTAPILSRIWSANEVLKYKNVTTAHTSTDFSSLPSEILPRINDCLIMVFPNLAMGEDVVITRAASTNYTSTMLYLASDNTSKQFQGVSDESNMYQVAASSVERKRRWTMPTDWVSKTITDKDGVIHTGYIACMRITAISVEGPVAPPQVTCKARCFGDANTDGIKFFAATTIKAVSISRIGIPSTTAMVAQLLNLTTGKGSSITIPANTVSSLNVDIDDIVYAANDKLGFAYQSGNAIKDIEIILQT